MKWNKISNNETRFTFTEWFQNFSTNRTSRDNIHEIFGGLLTLYLNSHSVNGRVERIVHHLNFVFSTLRSLQCKDCYFCSCSIDVFLNATLIKTLWNRCVEVNLYTMVREEELLMNRKTTLWNVPSRLYCHTKVILLPSKTSNGSGGFAVNDGLNSTKRKKINIVWKAQIFQPIK